MFRPYLYWWYLLRQWLYWESMFWSDPECYVVTSNSHACNGFMTRVFSTPQISTQAHVVITTCNKQTNHHVYAGGGSSFMIEDKVQWRCLIILTILSNVCLTIPNLQIPWCCLRISLLPSNLLSWLQITISDLVP